jgi:hypothetical protein
MLRAAALSLLLFAAAASAASKCPPVSLGVSGGPKQFTRVFGSTSAAFKKTSTNFAQAYAKACAEGLLKAKPLAPSGRLFLLNAPEANIGSIYASRGRTMFEYWFVTHDGHAHVPSAGQIHEAIYCATFGATAKEQEESGRCLPD